MIAFKKILLIVGVLIYSLSTVFAETPLFTRHAQVRVLDTHGNALKNVHLEIRTKENEAKTNTVHVVSDSTGIANFSITSVVEITEIQVYATYGGKQSAKMMRMYNGSSRLHVTMKLNIRNPYWNFRLLRKWRYGKKEPNATLWKAIKELSREDLSDNEFKKVARQAKVTHKFSRLRHQDLIISVIQQLIELYPHGLKAKFHNK